MSDAPERLRALARRIARLGLGGRMDPETAFIEREDVAQLVLGVARDLERSAKAGQRASPALPDPAVLRCRRLEAMLTRQTREAMRLHRLLAQATRLKRRLRRHPADSQLPLPLPETRHER
jgi:hypothetical protein